MGKGGRIACIATPWLLTVASLICIIIIEISGWNKGLLGDFYLLKANFTDLDVSAASTLANTTTLTSALELAEKSNALSDIYEVHLWNYCTSSNGESSSSSSSSNTDNIDYCSPKHANFYFDLLNIWGLNSTSTTSAGTPTVSTIPSSTADAINTIKGNLQNQTQALEQNLLGDAGAKAYSAYKKVAKIMFILYAIAFWTELLTLALSIFAICSRWGSLCTWAFSFISSVITLAAVALTTGVYLALLGSLRTLLDPYNIHLQIGQKAFITAWLGVVFSWAATLFWLFSICCCSGSSNPHHRSNKGGLWNAEPKGQGYGDYGRGRGIPVAKTGGYERVQSPYVGASNDHTNRVPMHDYPPQQTGHAYEPFRQG